MRSEETHSTDTLALLKMLADETRLSILCILSREDCYVELLASRLQLTPATVCYHLKKLESVGLVRCSRSQFYIIYALNREVLDCTLTDLITHEADKVLPVDPDRTYEAEVISHFFKYDRLIRLPAQQKKQSIVLREVARRLTATCKPGTDYLEREVDNALRAVFDDHCTLRRALIEEGLMTRRYESGKGDIYRLSDLQP